MNHLRILLDFHTYAVQAAGCMEQNETQKHGIY